MSNSFYVTGLTIRFKCDKYNTESLWHRVYN